MKALVTGGTKGIGLAITEKLLLEDFDVIVTYSSDSKNAETEKARLDKMYSDKLKVIQKHMESYEDVNEFLNDCKKEKIFQDGIDCLVLNAGTTDRTRWDSMSCEQWNRVMNINLNAPAHLIRGLNNYLNDDGIILFISSDMSIYPHATSVPYTVSKAAVNGLTLALVKEYAERKIRVNAILPGFVNTPWQKEKPQDQKERICDKVALGRFADPSEIADVAIGIIKSSYINGSLVQVDGGYCYR